MLGDDGTLHAIERRYFLLRRPERLPVALQTDAIVDGQAIHFTPVAGKEYFLSSYATIR